MISFDITTDTIDHNRLVQGVMDPRGGGIDLFLGIIRNHNDGHGVSHLFYEAYEEMALKIGQRILQESYERFEIYHASAIHRIGDLSIGETAVAIAVCAAHRDAAFKACRYIIDRIKEDVPIWKKEFSEDGEEWVVCSHSHDEAVV